MIRDVSSLTPSAHNIYMQRDTYLPAMSTRRIACGIEKPSNTGTACVTPSPESRTMPVVRPVEYLTYSLYTARHIKNG